MAKYEERPLGNPVSPGSMVKSSVKIEKNYDVDGGELGEVNVVRSKAFYYDRQIDKPLTQISLHANSFLDGNGEWQSMKKKSDSYMLDDEGYNETPLYKGILNEDFLVQAGNSWTDFGDDPIGSVWNSLKPYAPYASKLAETTQSMLKDTGEDSTIERLAKKALSKVSSATGTAAKLLNRSLITQGTRFSYYSGTSTSFGNLAMKFTVLPDYNGGGFTSVSEQLEELYPYIMGKYTKGILNDDKDGTIQGTETKGGDGIKTGITGEDAKNLNKFFSWQMPPAGYEPDFLNMDNILNGTLKLKFGAFYVLSSLVCTNAQFSFSKQVVKYWDSSKKMNILSPLYCDVVLNFQPATKYSDISLQKFISGQSTKNFVKAVKNGMKRNLTEEKKNIDKLLKNK